MMTNIRFKYIAAGICVLGFMIGWNVFLIQRDNQLFRAVYAQDAEVRK
jgi:hypothetical protein